MRSDFKLSHNIEFNKINKINLLLTMLKIEENKETQIRISKKK
jgi:hypothetical protein